MVEGNVFITFHEHGLNISGEGRIIYIDLISNVIDFRETTQKLVGMERGFATFDASSAMGMFTKESHKDYLAVMDALKKRVEEKMRKEGLRRL